MLNSRLALTWYMVVLKSSCGSWTRFRVTPPPAKTGTPTFQFSFALISRLRPLEKPSVLKVPSRHIFRAPLVLYRIDSRHHSWVPCGITKILKILKSPGKSKVVGVPSLNSPYHVASRIFRSGKSTSEQEQGTIFISPEGRGGSFQVTPATEFTEALRAFPQVPMIPAEDCFPIFREILATGK